MSEPIRGDKYGSARMADDALAKIATADKLVADLCQGTRKWTMSVPAQPSYDPDLLIADALQTARLAINTLVREANDTGTAVPDREPDGYAVLLDDANVAGTPGGCGYWYVGAYRTEVVAKDVAERGKQGARVVPMYFSVPALASAAGSRSFRAEIIQEDARLQEITIPRRFLSDFMKALDFHGGHGEPSFSRVSAVLLHEEARQLLASALAPTVPYPSNSSTTPKGE